MFNSFTFVFFLDYLFSLGKLTSEHVSKTAMQLKSVLEDKVASHTDVILVTELMNIKKINCVYFSIKKMVF